LQITGAGSTGSADRRPPPNDISSGSGGDRGINVGGGGNRGSGNRGSGFSSFDRNTIDDNRGSAGTSFGASPSRFDTNTRLGAGGNSNRNENRGTRPSPFVDRPGLFRPISTDFNNRDQFRNTDRDSFRDRGSSGNFNTNFRGGSSSGGAGGSSNNGLSGLFDIFGAGDRNSNRDRNINRDRNNDRFSNGFNDRRNQGNTGRFSSTALGPAADRERFSSSGDNTGGRPGGFGLGGLGGSSGIFSGNTGGGGGAATTSLGKIPGEGRI